MTKFIERRASNERRILPIRRLDTRNVLIDRRLIATRRTSIDRRNAS